MISLIVTILEKIGLALLGTFFATTANSAQSAGVDATALDWLSQLVNSASGNPALTTPDAQYSWVFEQAVSYFKSRGLDLAISLVDSLVSLAMHHASVSSNATAPTISTLTAKAG